MKKILTYVFEDEDVLAILRPNVDDVGSVWRSWFQFGPARIRTRHLNNFGSTNSRRVG